MINNMDNNQTQNQMSNTPETNGYMQKRSNVGSIVATIVIIALIVLGGLYFWGKRIETEKANQVLIQNTASGTEMTASADATKIETVSQDDNLNTIGSELNTTKTDNLSPELQ